MILYVFLKFCQRSPLNFCSNSRIAVLLSNFIYSALWFLFHFNSIALSYSYFMTLVVVVFNFLVEPYFPMYNHRRRHDCGANHEINESDLNRKKFVSDDRAENVFIVSHFWMYRERCCKASFVSFLIF